jgi:arylsulfatase A-like enzyme
VERGKGGFSLKVDVGRRIRSGVINGIEVWAAYGIAEYVYSTIGSLMAGIGGPSTMRWLGNSTSLSVMQWRGTVSLFLVYSLCGMLLGILTALLVPRHDLEGFRCRKLLVLSLVAVYGLHVARSRDLVGLASFAAAALIALAVIRDLGGTAKRQGLAGQPLVVSFALIYSSSASETSFRWPVAILFAVATAALVLGAGIAFRALRSRLAPRQALRDAVVAASILGLVFGPNLLSTPPKAGNFPMYSATAAGKPNIVLVTLDTVRADHMGIYGYGRANTPNLRAFAQGATFYSNFIAASSITLTSHASIFTGLYPQSHGAYRIAPDFPKGRPLPDTIPTAAAQLDAAGYRTMAVVANRYYMRPEWGLERGFQYVSVGCPVVMISTNHAFLLRNPVRRHLLTFNGISQDLDAYTWGADEVNRQAFDLLEQAARKQTPFFLFLNYMDAHSPYIVPPPYSQRYPGRDPSFTGADYSPLEFSVDDEGTPLSPRVRDHLVSQYDGAIAYLDAQLGALVARLKHLGIYDNTLIIITSDHGEALGEKGFISHDVSTSQSQVHVPLIVKYPHQVAADRVDTLASHVDLMPTMMEVAGLPIPSGVEGISLLHARTETSRVIVAECHSDLSNHSHYRRLEYSLFSGPMKFVYSPKGGLALYDLATDPEENHNLYRAADPAAAALQAKLEQWSLSTVPHFTKGQFPSGKAAKALESLGYAH